MGTLELIRDFDRRMMLGVDAGLWVAWVGGTAVDPLLGKVVGDTVVAGGVATALARLVS